MNTHYQLKRKPINIKAENKNIDSIPGQLSKEVLQSLEGHSNWELMGGLESDRTIKERIFTVEGHIRENSEGTEAQAYCLLAYYKSILKEKSLEEDDDPIKILDKALDQINNYRSVEGVGYRAVILANKVICHAEKKDHNSARSALEEYKKVTEDYEGNLKDHPEVLAMKGFAYGYTLTFENANKGIAAYTKALSNDLYKDNVPFLYGLYFAKLTATRGRDKYKDDTEEMESILRRIINLDKTHGVAMIKLAKLLVNNKAFEEADFWINNAIEIIPNTKHKLIIYEEAANVYLLKLYCDYDKNGINKAMKWYKEAEKINGTSRKALSNLGRCYMKKYFAEDIRKKDKNNVPQNLKDARMYYEKGHEWNKRNYEKAHLAEVYENTAKYKHQKHFLKKAEEIYLEIIKDTENENKIEQEAEFSHKYASFLSKHNNDNRVKEIFYLKKAVAAASQRSATEPDFYFSQNCQDQLLKYASDTEIMSKKTSLEIKSWIQEKRGNIQTAIFYLRKAIENETDEEVSYTLAALLLEASTKEHATENILKEAIEVIKELPFTIRKQKLETRAKEIQLSTRIGVIGNLKRLHDCTLALEKYESKEFEDLGFNVIFESRRILDRGMNLVKKEIYVIPHDKPPFSYYPTPKALSKLTGTVDQKMEKFLEKSNLKDFKTKLPELFSFLTKRQPPAVDYDWLQTFFDERNEKEHAEFYSKMKHDECLEISQKASNLATDFWKMAEQAVKKYLSATSFQNS